MCDYRIAAVEQRSTEPLQEYAANTWRNLQTFPKRLLLTVSSGGEISTSNMEPHLNIYNCSHFGLCSSPVYFFVWSEYIFFIHHPDAQTNHKIVVSVGERTAWSLLNVNFELKSTNRPKQRTERNKFNTSSILLCTERLLSVEWSPALKLPWRSQAAVSKLLKTISWLWSTAEAELLCCRRDRCISQNKH